MNDTDKSAVKPGGGTPPDANAAGLPSAHIVSAVVAKIKSEPLLFIIAVIVLICGVAVQATSMGSGNFRFALIVIVILAVVAMLGYYTLQALQALRRPRPTGPEIDAAFTGQKVAGKATGVRVREMSSDVGLRARVKVDEVTPGGEVTGVDIDHFGGSPRTPSRPAEEPGKVAPDDPPTS